MKVFITGSSTVGKSTVVNKLKRRGFTAVNGEDEPGLARLELHSTGEPVEWPQGLIDWSTYSWNLQAVALKEVLARDKTVFLAGIFGNQPDFYPLFDKLIVLTITSEEYKKCLDNRPRRSVGDSEQNMAERFRKYPILLQRFLDAGAIPIDASSTVQQTVDEILKQTAYEY